MARRSSPILRKVKPSRRRPCRRPCRRHRGEHARAGRASSPRTGTWGGTSSSAAREAGVARLINLGSSCMYPKDSPRPLTEEDILSGPLEPTNEAYAIAKSAVQRLCGLHRQRDPGIPVQDADPLQSLRPLRHLRSEALAPCRRRHPQAAPGEGRGPRRRSRSGATARRGASSSMPATSPTRSLPPSTRFDSAAAGHERRRRHRPYGQRLLRGRRRGRRLHRHASSTTCRSRSA